jgi:hypothetical protein
MGLPSGRSLRHWLRGAGAGRRLPDRHRLSSCLGSADYLVLHATNHNGREAWFKLKSSHQLKIEMPRISQRGCRYWPGRTNLLSSEASVELANGAETFTISRRGLWSGQRVAVHSSGQTHEEASRAGSWRPTACRIKAAAAGRLKTTMAIFLQRYY